MHYGLSIWRSFSPCEFAILAFEKFYLALHPRFQLEKYFTAMICLLSLNFFILFFFCIYYQFSATAGCSSLCEKKLCNFCFFRSQHTFVTIQLYYGLLSTFMHKIVSGNTLKLSRPLCQTQYVQLLCRKLYSCSSSLFDTMGMYLKLEFR